MDLDAVLTCGPGAVAVPVGDDVVVVDEERARLHLLDGPAGAVWSRLDGVRPLREVARAVAEAYGAPLDVVERDVAGLADRLVADGAAQQVTSPGPGR